MAEIFKPTEADLSIYFPGGQTRTYYICYYCGTLLNIFDKVFSAAQKNYTKGSQHDVPFDITVECPHCHLYTTICYKFLFICRYEIMGPSDYLSPYPILSTFRIKLDDAYKSYIHQKKSLLEVRYPKLPALHIATLLNSEEMMAEALNHNDITVTDENSNLALHHALRHAKYRACKFLIEHGSPTNIVDQFGVYPISYVFFEPITDRKIYSAMLVKQGDAKLDVYDKKGLGLFHIATLANDAITIHKLYELTTAENDHLLNQQTQDKHKKTPLHLAIEHNAKDAFLALLKLKADPFAKDGQGKTPLESLTSSSINRQFYQARLEKAQSNAI